MLVYLDISDEVAKRRLLSRQRLSDAGKTYEEIVAHPMEIERAKLRDVATVILVEDTVEHHVALLYPPK